MHDGCTIESGPVELKPGELDDTHDSGAGCDGASKPIHDGLEAQGCRGEVGPTMLLSAEVANVPRDAMPTCSGVELWKSSGWWQASKPLQGACSVDCTSGV